MVTATEHLCEETLVQSVVLSKLAIFPLGVTLFGKFR